MTKEYGGWRMGGDKMGWAECAILGTYPAALGDLSSLLPVTQRSALGAAKVA